jgi:L-ascorbate metabolism protein UlaG (beta-lactamase superfamily)
VIEPVQSDDALLRDLALAADGPRRLHVWWLGQSGFLCRRDGDVLLFDPYLSDALTRKYDGTDKPHVRMSRRVVDPSALCAVHLITSTHMHTDHADAETLRAIHAANVDATGNRPIVLAAQANVEALRERLGRDGVAPPQIAGAVEGEAFGHPHRDIVATAVAAAHPQLTRDAAGRPTHVAFVVRMGPFTLFHGGDGVLHDGFAEAIRDAARGPIDLAILPINGQVGNMDGADAARLARKIDARLVVPCHYHLFEFNTAEPVERFVPECQRIGQPFRVLRLGERLTLEAWS